MKSILGGALAAQGKYADAEPFLIEGFKSIDADPKAPKKRRVDAPIALFRCTNHRASRPTPSLSAKCAVLDPTIDRRRNNLSRSSTPLPASIPTRRTQ